MMQIKNSLLILDLVELKPSLSSLPFTETCNIHELIFFLQLSINIDTYTYFLLAYQSPVINIDYDYDLKI